MGHIIRTFLLGVIGMVATANVSAIPIHFFDAGSADPAELGAPITAAGHTPTQLFGLSAADLASVDVLWIANGSNSSAPIEFVSNASDIATWVRGGGVLSYHDRYVSDGSDNMSLLLPGAGSLVFNRDFSNSADIDISDFLSPVVAGLDNNSLDGGNSSSHGWVDISGMPGANAVLHRGGSPTEIVDLYYQFGAGWVYYSTIPLDFYLAGAGNNPPRDNIRNIYAVNEAGFQASLANVPEPGTIALFGLGLAGLGFARRKKA